MNTMFDPRITPARADIAALHLFGVVTAQRYVNATSMRVSAPTLALRASPSARAAMMTQALYGETILIYEENNGWGWGQLTKDSYVGYCELAHLAKIPDGAQASGSERHGAGATGTAGAFSSAKITVLASFIYPEPSIKTPPLMALPLGAEIAVRPHNAQFLEVADGGYLFARHLAPLRRKEDDFIHIAEAFIGLPYLWGGKTHLGLDCSGLVQIALQAIGVECPRDSDMQQAALGKEVSLTILKADPLSPQTDHHKQKLPPLPELKRGDLVFWPGHVGIMRDGRHLLHANAHHMLVASEPLLEARARVVQNTGHDILAVRRLDRISAMHIATHEEA